MFYIPFDIISKYKWLYFMTCINLFHYIIFTIYYLYCRDVNPYFFYLSSSSYKTCLACCVRAWPWQHYNSFSCSASERKTQVLIFCENLNIVQTQHTYRVNRVKEEKKSNWKKNIFKWYHNCNMLFTIRISQAHKHGIINMLTWINDSLIIGCHSQKRGKKFQNWFVSNRITAWPSANKRSKPRFWKEGRE